MNLKKTKKQRALAGAAQNLTKPDSLIRAGKLLFAVAEHTTSNNHPSAVKDFVSGLSTSLFSTFLSTVGPDKEVSSWYLSALGMLLGSRNLTTYVNDIELTSKLTEQKSIFIQHITSMLTNVAEECVNASHGDGDAQGGESISFPEAMTSTPLIPTRSSSVLQAASTLGYIPTVPGIGDTQPLNSGDEQLGRVLSGVASFLSTDPNRVLFCSTRGNAPTALASLLDKDVSAPVQVYYQTVFCLWLLSFVVHQAAIPDAVHTVSASLEVAGVPRRLTNVLREVSSEKVVRISLATLRNILSMSPTLRKEMVGAGLVDALQSPSFRRLDDDDIRDDLGVLADALESELASMSSFDVYKAEVLSGALEWTPAHRDEVFWRENVEKLDRNQQEVLRCMVRLLHESNDETILAVACNDLAQFIKFHPRGRAIAQSLGVKARLMELMVSGEGDVRRYALNCVQVLMIRWNRT